MARSLVRNRAAVTKLFGLKSQLQAVSLRLQTLKSTQSMADAMKGATKVIHNYHSCFDVNFTGYGHHEQTHESTRFAENHA